MCTRQLTMSHQWISLRKCGENLYDLPRAGDILWEIRDAATHQECQYEVKIELNGFICDWSLQFPYSMSSSPIKDFIGGLPLKIASKQNIEAR